MSIHFSISDFVNAIKQQKAIFELLIELTLLALNSLNSITKIIVNLNFH